jgi:hypothetical protein
MIQKFNITIALREKKMTLIATFPNLWSRVKFLITGTISNTETYSTFEDPSLDNWLAWMENERLWDEGEWYIE